MYAMLMLLPFLHALPLFLGDVTVPSTFPPATSDLFKLFVAAVLASSAVVSVWYVLGAILNNNAVKSNAQKEFYQLIGTVLLMGAVVIAMYAFGSVFAGTLIGGGFSTPCFQLAQSGSGAVLAFIQQLLSPPSSVCGILATAQASTGTDINSMTAQIDFPMAFATFLTATITNQTVTNFNAVYKFDAWISFLSSFTQTDEFCAQVPVPGWEAIGTSPCFPVPTVMDPLWTVTFKFKWFSGLDMVSQGIASIIGLMNITMDVLIVQLVFDTVLLNFWPYIIFAGMTLRSTVFTRKLGGLLIAIAVAGITIYPSLFAIEYLTVTNVQTNYPTRITYCSQYQSSVEKNLDFFVQPDLAQIASACECYPYASTLFGQGYGDLFGQEMTTWAFFNLPILGEVSGGLATLFGAGNLVLSVLAGFGGAPSLDTVNSTYTGVFGSSASALGISTVATPVPSSGDLPTSPQLTVPILGAPYACNEFNASNALFNMIEAYAPISITAWFLPILNILLMLASIRALSGLLGGDTSLGGLGRLV